MSLSGSCSIDAVMFPYDSMFLAGPTRQYETQYETSFALKVELMPPAISIDFLAAQSTGRGKGGIHVSGGERLGMNEQRRADIDS